MIVHVMWISVQNVCHVVLLWVVTLCGYRRFGGTAAAVFRALEAVCNAYLFVCVCTLWNHRVFSVVL